MKKNMKNSLCKGSLIIPAVFALMFLLSVSSSMAASQPMVPYAVYGSATLNGDPLPAGSVITAVIGGEEKVSVTTKSEGSFGGPNMAEGAENNLRILDGSPGDTVHFIVKAPTMHTKIEAKQTAIWKSGEIEEVTLDFTGQDMVSYFYGKASLADGEPAPVGSVITAEIDGVVHGSITITEEGKYGSADGEKLSVFNGLNGDEVTFFIKLPDSSKKIQANQTGTWRIGETTELNLDFIGEETDADPVCSFYGNAFFNYSFAPVGSVITAEIDGVVHGSITITEEGKYGSEKGAKLEVYNGKNGDVINFFIKTPDYENKVESSRESVWIENRTREFDLRFVPLYDYTSVQATNNQADDGSNNNGVVQGEPETVTENAGSQGTGTSSKNIIFNVKENMDESDSATVEMGKGDVARYELGGNLYEISIKSTSDFGILISINGIRDIVIANEEAKAIDLDGDGVNDVEIKVEKIKDGKATLSFARIGSETVPVNPLTGMVISGLNIDPTIIVASVIVIIVLVGGIITVNKRRGRRSNERNFKAFGF